MLASQCQVSFAGERRWEGAADIFLVLTHPFLHLHIWESILSPQGTARLRSGVGAPEPNRRNGREAPRAARGTSPVRLGRPAGPPGPCPSGPSPSVRLARPAGWPVRPAGPSGRLARPARRRIPGMPRLRGAEPPSESIQCTAELLRARRRNSAVWTQKPRGGGEAAATAAARRGAMRGQWPGVEA